MYILIGPPGAGKSTLGNALAKHLNLPCFDIDLLIEQQENKSRQDLWRECEVHYRHLEKQIIHNLPLTPAIIASGGGSILDPDNVNQLMRRGKFIYLNCPYAVIEKRLQSMTRGMHIDQKLIEQRIPLYEMMAHITIDATKSIADQMMDICGK